MKLTDRIYLVGGSAFGYSSIGDCNMYLVDCNESLVLIDTGGGMGIQRVLTNIRDMNLNPNNIEIAINTHCHYDHIGGNKDIKEKTGCKIAAHASEKKEIETLGELTLYEMAVENGLSFKPTKVDIDLKGEQKIKVGDVEFKIIHTPGHTPGGISIVFNEDNYVNLFSGDTASAQGRMGFINGPGFDLPKWKHSIKKMLRLKPDRLFPGHGVFVLSSADEHFDLLDKKMNAPWINIVTTIG